MPLTDDPPSGSRVGTVLLIDDDPDPREGLAILLGTRGFAVEAVASGADALASLAAGLRPSIIILDLKLTGVTAQEFRRAQLLDPAVRSVPVILLSGADDIRERAEELMAVTYLCKPVEMDELAAALEEHCLR